MRKLAAALSGRLTPPLGAFVQSPPNTLDSSFSIRRAEQSDVPALIDLMREFYAESHFTLDDTWAETSFSALLPDPGLGCVWIAERDGRSAGHAVLTVRYTMEHGALSGYIDDLYVRPECRRLGLARALVTELTRECQQRRCRSMYVEVGQDNEPALGLYRAFGLGPYQDGRILLNGVIDHVGT